MPKCNYCSKEYEKHKGVTVIDSVSGNMKHYCSSKCRKNEEMKRKKRKWTKPEKKTFKKKEEKEQDREKGKQKKKKGKKKEEK